MIVLFPIAWPFLILWALCKHPRVAVTLLAIGAVVAISIQHPVWGTVLGFGLMILVIRAIVSRQARQERDAELAWQRSEHRRELAAADQYAMMELQAELNARAMAKVAREM